MSCTVAPLRSHRGWLVCAGMLAMCGTLLAGPERSSASELRRTAIVRAIERVSPSVVNIHGEKQLSREEAALAHLDQDRRVNGMGTGVVIDERGYILTNQHVVEGVKQINVTLHDARTFTARLISRDVETDLAVIKVDAGQKLPVIEIGTSADLMPGEPVIAVGNAFGYENTVTRGIISALHRSVEVGEGQRYDDLIQTDASINPGNSGGPLLNIDGALIGINVAVRAGAQGIGFAIPIDKALAVAADLLSVRRVQNTWHGLVAKPAGSQHTGLVVQSVVEDSPASRSGLRAGDVITQAAGLEVVRPLDLERAFLGRKPGEEVELKVLRQDESVDLRLSLAKAPASDAAETSSEAAWDVLGLKLAAISSKRFREYQSPYRGGLSVVAVRPGSPAAQQGIRRGDVLVGMHEWETISLENVAYILSRPDLADFSPVKFYILRDKHTLFGHLPVRSQVLR